MYIFEIITAFIKGKKYEKLSSDFIPEDIIEKSEECEHFFLPLDSSNELFACKFCGIIEPRKKLKDKNIFKALKKDKE